MEEIRYLLRKVAEALNHSLAGIIISSPMLLWLYTTNMITFNILLNWQRQRLALINYVAVE